MQKKLGMQSCVVGFGESPREPVLLQGWEGMVSKSQACLALVRQSQLFGEMLGIKEVWPPFGDHLPKVKSQVWF